MVASNKQQIQYTRIQGRRQLREIGGAKLKSGVKGFRQNPKAFSGRNHKFSDQKQVISKIKLKKKVFAEIRKLFLPDIANFNVFSAQKHQLLPPKKIPWGARKKSGGQKRKSGGHCPPAPPLATRLQEFEEIHNIGSLETPKQVRIPPITKYSRCNEKCADRPISWRLALSGDWRINMRNNNNNNNFPENLDKKKITCSVFIDLSKAFNTCKILHASTVNFFFAAKRFEPTNCYTKDLNVMQ